MRGAIGYLATAAGVSLALALQRWARAVVDKKPSGPMAILAALTDPNNPAPLDAMKALKASLADRAVTPAGLPVLEFLEHVTRESLPVIDVRSPAEFAQGHIPGATSLPLFSNEQRAIVGTAYAEQGKEAAMVLAIGLVGPKLPELLAAAHKATVGRTKEIAVHCWRGGMRSGAVALLLRGNGFKTVTLAGGYKGFRGWLTALWDRTPLAAAAESAQGAEEDVEDILGCITPEESSAKPVVPPVVTEIPPPKVHAAAPPESALSDSTETVHSKPVLARLSKSEKKLANKAKRQGKKRVYKEQDKQTRIDQELQERQQEVAPLRPDPSTAAEWEALESCEALGRLRICVVAGRTGVGKTRVLKELERLGMPVLDLEVRSAQRLPGDSR